MLEFALMAPLLFLLLLGTIDFGRAIFFSNEITNAAREGARVAILASNPCNTQIANPSGNCTSSSGSGVNVCSAIEQEANLIPTGNWTCGENTAAVPPGSHSPNNAYVEVSSADSCTSASVSDATPRTAGNRAVRVTIVYYFRPLTGMIAAFFPNNYYLKSTTCMRQEW